MLAWAQVRPRLPKSRRFLILLCSDLICTVLTEVSVSQREGGNQSCPYFCSFMRSCMQMIPRSINCTGFPFTRGWLYVAHVNPVFCCLGRCFWSTNEKQAVSFLPFRGNPPAESFMMPITSFTAFFVSLSVLCVICVSFWCTVLLLIRALRCEQSSFFLNTT